MGATIIKILSPVLIEYSARRRRSMTPRLKLQDHHLAMILYQHLAYSSVRVGARQREVKACEWHCRGFVLQAW